MYLRSKTHLLRRTKKLLIYERTSRARKEDIQMIDNMTRDKYTLDALAKVYISLHIFDLVEDKLFPLKSNEHIERWSEGFESCQEKL